VGRDGRLGELELPVLYTAGRYDEIRPEHVAEMHERTPGSELVVFEGSAHLPFEEERELFMATLRDFLARAESRG
jgi:pimeloyl-ACP methyl ester carboxylesterase